MQLQELYEKIDLQPEVKEKLEEISGKVSLSRWETYLKGMSDPETAEASYQELSAALPEDPGNFIMLYCQLECARRAADRYAEKEIPESIFVDTMKCFSRFLDECKRKNGQMYFDRGWWTYRQISMSLFRIGELEYELQPFNDKNAIGIHIPSDADLTPSKVDLSMKEAVGFMEKYYPDPARGRFICESWLLSPVLKELLPENSKILAFQNRFEIISENREDRDYIEWVFQAPPGTEIRQLPEKTSLQRNVKRLLLEGGNVGAACGIIGISGKNKA